MTVLKQYNSVTSQWEPIVTGTIGATGPTGVTGPTGPTGPLGIISSATAPVSPSAGQVWFNTTTGSSYIYYNSAWVELGGGSMSPMQTTSSARPAAPWEGQTIYDTDTNIGYQYDGTNFAPTYPGSGFRNELINGGFDIWQRWVATSINVDAGTTAYTADRWFMSPVGSTMGAIRDSNVPPTSLSKYSLQIAPNGTSGSTCKLGQRIESANVYALKGTVTFSAWIFNNTSASMTPVLLLGTPSAEDNFTTVTNRLTQSLQSCANGAWTKVTHTVDISGYTNINNGLQVEIQTSGHTTFGRIVRIAEVQLERNAQPTPFEQRPIGIELALCQRYYEVQRSVTYLMHYSGTATNILYTKPFVVQKRTTPTPSSVVNNYTVNTRNFGVYDASTWYHGGAVASGSATGNYLDDLTCTFSAEL